MIGRATGEHLAASRCDVLAVDVKAAALAEMEKRDRTGGRVVTFVADVVGGGDDRDYICAAGLGRNQE
jgi:hypothetical protein